MKYIIVFIICLTFSSFAQMANPVHFPLQNGSMSNTESFLLGSSDNYLFMFWYDSSAQAINLSKSTDQGENWSNNFSIYNSANFFGIREINAIRLNTGRILLTFRDHDYYSIYSDDNGLTWSSSLQIPISYAFAPLKQTSLSKSVEGEAIFIYTEWVTPSDSIGVNLLCSSDGISWSCYDEIDATGGYGYFLNVNPDKNLLVYEYPSGSQTDLVYRSNTDLGYGWSERQTILSDGFNNHKPRLMKDNTGKIWLLYYRNDPTAFQNFKQDEIYFITSTDDGNSWSQPEKFTDYIGKDDLLSISVLNGSPIVSFTTSRDFYYDNKSFQIYYGIPGITIDDSTPPYLFDFSAVPEINPPYESIIFRAFADDENSISQVTMVTDFEGGIDSLEMYDDGLHGDSLSGDNIYGYILNGLPAGFLHFNFVLKDVNGNVAYFQGDSLSDPAFHYHSFYMLDENRLRLPLDDEGNLAYVSINDSIGLRFDESTVLFSGGFLMGGFNQGEVWVNGVAPANLVSDYLPGPVGGISYSIYVVKASDQPFGNEWINFRNAVNLGADFYDGDNNGVYDPVDLNGNGTWDTNEDRPDLLGDATAWCVYNDAVPSNQRYFNDVSPLGIEIKQTLFAIGNESNPVNNIIFIRYKIINKGTVAPLFNSVYFGIWDDPDIGAESSQDDLVGCDTVLNIGYSYNDGTDSSYGTNPPAFAAEILAGPVSYIAGETYIDVNANNQYDEGIDTPLDTAYVNRGEYLGINIFPGAKNSEETAFVHTINGDPYMRDPANRLEARNCLLGKSVAGEIYDPCTLPYGNVFGEPCNEVNPLFLYSGDPVTNTGWVNTYPSDYRILTSTGPFTLHENEPIDIWIAYVVGRGNNALESVTKTKEYSAAAQYFYNSNFTQLPSDVRNESNYQTISDFRLYQNYPNPFNPGTKINFTIAQKQFVKLKVFDILGREVRTLINEEKSAGIYSIEFDGSSLASGVYFYQLKAGDNLETRKMILLK